jgi:hypothetical protein
MELGVHEDPTIDPTKGAGANADAIAAQLTASVTPCANAKITHAPNTTMLAVDFGAGCTLPHVGAVSGSVSVTVSTGAGVTIAFTFDDLTVAGLSVSGTASETTTNGTSYSANVSLTTSSGALTFQGVAAIDANGSGVTLNGKASVQGQNYTVTNVHHTFGGCYADAGTLQVANKPVTSRSGKATTVNESITFASTTPSTGRASLTIGSQSMTVTLPTYGTCPHA